MCIFSKKYPILGLNFRIPLSYLNLIPNLATMDIKMMIGFENPYAKKTFKNLEYPMILSGKYPSSITIQWMIVNLASSLECYFVINYFSPLWLFEFNFFFSFSIKYIIDDDGQFELTSSVLKLLQVIKVDVSPFINHLCLCFPFWLTAYTKHQFPSFCIVGVVDDQMWIILNYSVH